MDPLNTVGAGLEVVKYTCTPFARRICYLWKIEKNMVILGGKNRDLVAIETDIRREIRRAEVQRRMAASNRVMVLLDKIEKVKGRVSDIARSFEESYRCFFNFPRLKLAKRVTEAIQDLDRLLQETNQFANELVVEQSPPRAELLVAPPLVGDSTVKRNLNAILQSLRNPLIGKIGIFAMGGAGKTTTMKNIHNQLVHTQDFDKIIWVTVPKDSNLDRVQGNIAQQLNLDLSMYADEEHRAARLFNKLKQTNKFLIIFDDVWNRVPLEKVGIPEPNTENKCKIVLTTRSLAVCRDMETHLNIKLELLSKGEAWDLFVSKAGNPVLNSKLETLAKEVIRECGGLPLAINTIGRALRDEVSIRMWRRAVQDLKDELN